MDGWVKQAQDFRRRLLFVSSVKVKVNGTLSSLTNIVKLDTEVRYRT